MVARIVLLAVFAAFIAGCASVGEVSGDVASRPKVDSDAAAQQAASATTIDQWAAANKNNGAPGESSK